MKKAYLIVFISILFILSCEDKKDTTPSDRTVSEPFPGSGIVTDIDGNVYQTITLGDQEWMVENLKVTHYRNGDSIPTGHTNTEWINLSTGAYGVYGDIDSNANTYGYLYNWYAVDDSRNIAPDGWHVPSDNEWKELEMHLGMSQSEANKLFDRGTNEGSKLAGNAELWIKDISLPTITDDSEFGTSGFTALPGAFRGDVFGEYRSMGESCCFWSTSVTTDGTSYYRILHFLNQSVFRWDTHRQSGFSIRCVKD